jgi:signal transduction histidine kinase
MSGIQEARAKGLVVDGEPSSLATLEALLAQAQSQLQASEARLQALATLALALAEVSARDEVAAIVVEQGMRAAHADTCTLYVLDETGSRLELIGHHGVAPEIVERLRIISDTEGNPGTFATMKSRTTLWAESDADYERIYPQLAAVKADGRRARAFWSVPLIVEGSPIGLLGMGYYEPRAFPPAERSFVETFTKQCAQALARARRLEERERNEIFKEVFVGMLGHDLRNPLSTILMTAQMMALRDELPPGSAVKIRRILTSGERMHRMIEQILDMTRARSAGGIVVTRSEERDLVPLVARIVDELRVANQGRTIDLRMNGAVSAGVDADRLEQVLSNLLSNALAHGDREKPVTVTMRQDDDVATIAVHNHGPPIAPEFMPLLFNPFARSQKHGGRSAGLGLGLYISERIVSAHGGRLDVESSAELGTRFEVRIPRRA